MQISVSISSLQQQKYKLKTRSEVPQKLPSWNLSEKFMSPLVRQQSSIWHVKRLFVPRGARRLQQQPETTPPHLGSKRQRVKLNVI